MHLIKSRVRALCGKTTPRVALVRAERRVRHPGDTSGIQALDVIHSELKAEGIQLLVVRPKLYMRRYGESTGIGLRVGRENVLPRCERLSRRCTRVRGAPTGSRP